MKRMIWSITLLILACASALRSSPVSDRQVSVARQLIMKGDYVRATEILTQVLWTAPTNKKAKALLSRSVRMMNAKNSPESLDEADLTLDERAGIVSQAYRYLKKASPNVIQNYFKDARQHERRQLFILAARSYLQVLALSGLSLEMKYETEKELRKVDKKIDLKIESMPQSYRSIYRDAFTLMSVGDWRVAVERWDEYVRSNPHDGEIKKLLSQPDAEKIVSEARLLAEANSALIMDDFSKAEKLFKKTIELNPERQEAIKGLETLDDKINQKKRGEAVSGYMRKATQQAAAGENLKALETLYGAMKEDPTNPQIISIIQEVHKNLKVNQGTVNFVRIPELKQERDVVQSVRDPAQGETHYQKGLVYYGLRKFSEAAGEWQQAVKFDPVNQKAIRALERVKSDLRTE